MDKKKRNREFATVSFQDRFQKQFNLEDKAEEFSGPTNISQKSYSETKFDFDKVYWDHYPKRLDPVEGKRGIERLNYVVTTEEEFKDFVRAVKAYNGFYQKKMRLEPEAQKYIMAIGKFSEVWRDYIPPPPPIFENTQAKINWMISKGNNIFGCLPWDSKTVYETQQKYEERMAFWTEPRRAFWLERYLENPALPDLTGIKDIK